MPRTSKFRLSVMMFLEYCVPGAFVPILSLYLASNLGFAPKDAGLIMAMPALAAIVAPFMASHIADRFIGAERMLALCHVLCGTVMLILSVQTRFWLFLPCYFLYGLLFAPTYGLTNTVTLHHVADAKRDFGGIRMWGTASWVFLAWTFGYLWLAGNPERLRHALILSALSSFALAIYALTLPRAQVHEDAPKTLTYWKAMRVFAQPGLALLCVLTFVNGMTHQFFYFGMSPFLHQLGFANNEIMPFMSLGQVSEVVVLAILGICMARLGTKRIMVLGALAQVVRFIAFLSPATPSIFVGIVMHGFCYAFWFTAAYIYVDQRSTPETRAGAQQLFTIVISGLGAFGGFQVAGYAGQWCLSPETGLIDFQRFWLVPLFLSAATALTLALFFRETAAPEKES